MKRLILTTLPALLALGAVAPAAVAQTDPDVRPSYTSVRDVRATEAFNLVSLAYRGEFEDEGISSYGQLVQDYRTGDITAEDVVRAGIEDGYLSERALDDGAYLNAVATQLNAFTIGN